MNELQHSLAYSSSLLGSSLGWDYHNYLGLLNSDIISLMPAAAAMDGYSASDDSQLPYSSFSSPPPPPHHHQDCDFSSGYLEDALLEFGQHPKRRRLMQLPYHDYDDQSKISPINDDLDKSLWNFNPTWHQPVENNLYCTNQIERICGFSDEHMMSMFRSRIREESNILVAETESTVEETIISVSESPNSYSSNSCNKQLVSSKPAGPTLTPPDGPAGGILSDEDEEMVERRKKVAIGSSRRTRVVYPFAVVKPGGISEGEVTLNDINERILMAPTRAVRHPVGEYACRPCVSPHGPGLSGKAVVALTRIHTLGRRGTITIIRTKG